MVFRGVIKTFATLGWTSLLLPLQLFALRTGGSLADRIPKIYHRGAARILGLQVTVRGEPSRAAPVLYVANHASWLDIVALGSVLEAGFVAKTEVASWPGFGLLAKLQRSVFINRDRHKTRSGINLVSEYMGQGRRLILFPEGTSNDGINLLPFRSSFFAVAEPLQSDSPVPVQPVSISYVRRARLPLVRSRMPAIAWDGDMTLLPHLWQMFCEGGHTEVVLEFHPEADFRQFSSRKALARHCHDRVSSGLSRARQAVPSHPGS